MAQLTTFLSIVSFSPPPNLFPLLTTSTIGATQSVDYLVNPVGFKKISKSDVPTAGTVTWSSYEGLKHETNYEELKDIQKW